jgi:hypothetical protein
MDELIMWVVYDHPKDYAGFIARKFIIRQPPVATDETMTGELETIRGTLRRLGLVSLSRHPKDDRCIVEVWL